MSATRLVRSGRCRLIISSLAFLLTLAMIVVFHSTQQQLAVAKDQVLLCEQQQDGLNIRLQSIVEQKYSMVKSNEREREDLLETHKSLEQKLETQKQLYLKEEMECRVQCDQQQQSLTRLQSEHVQLLNDCTKAKKQYVDEVESLKKELLLLRSDLEKERRKSSDGDYKQCKTNCDSILREKNHLQLRVNESESEVKELKENVKKLEHIIAECKSDYNDKPRFRYESPPQIRKPINSAAMPHNATFDVPTFNHKSFSKQELVNPDLYIIPLSISNQTASASTTGPINAENISLANSFKNASANSLHPIDPNGEWAHHLQDNLVLPPPHATRNNPSPLFIQSVENFQIAPKPIKSYSGEDGFYHNNLELRQTTTSTFSGSSPNVVPNVVNEKLNISVNVRARTSSIVSSSSSPLISPPSQIVRKLPDNVAPIPENFDELLKNESIEKENGEKFENIIHNLADINAIVGDDIHNMENEHNNRYLNVVNDLGQKTVNQIIDAHEIKNVDFVHKKNEKLSIEDDNFFGDGGGEGNRDGVINKKQKSVQDDSIMGTGVRLHDAIADKNPRLDEGDNLNNEVVGDQGKEFPDGINLEDGNEEDEDEDDYSNPAARLQVGQAIRN